MSSVSKSAQNRDSFRSKWGFILACIGSAVGMGNIWLFPYRLATYGGTFLLIYLIFDILIGFSGVVGEMTLGRAARSGPVGAFRQACASRGHGKLGTFIGGIPMLGALALAIGYSVVVGWIFKYTFGCFTGATIAPATPDEFGAAFGATASAFGNNLWLIVALAATFVIMVLGISAGIEKANKVMIPLFYALFIGLAIYVAFQPGASDGYKWMFTVDPEKLTDPMLYVYALGQSFFSLSLAGTGTVVYGSYLKKDQDIPTAARTIALFDTLAALLSAFVIMPAVFAYGLDPASGPPLMFITMPEVFKQMPGGSVFMIIFFAAVLFAALTSLVNLFETPVEALQTFFGMNRVKAVAIVAVIGTVVGVCIEGIVSGWMDICSIYLCPLGALMAGVMIFWVCGGKYAKEKAEEGASRPLGKWFVPAGKFIFCGVTLFVLIMGIAWGGIG